MTNFQAITFLVVGLIVFFALLWAIRFGSYWADGYPLP